MLLISSRTRGYVLRRAACVSKWRLKSSSSNALLVHCNLYSIGQDFVAASFVSSDLHLELIQRSSHVAFEGLRQHIEQQRRLSTNCCRLVFGHESMPTQQPFTIGRDRIWPNLFWPSLFDRILAKPNLAVTAFGQIGRREVWGRGVGGGGGVRGGGGRRVGARRVGAEGWGARKVTGPKFRAFFPSSATVSLFFSLWGLLVEFWWCLKRRRGFTRQPESPNVHIRGSPPSKTPPKLNEKAPQRERKERKWERERGKKSEILGGPGGRGGLGEGRSWGRWVRAEEGGQKC